MWHSCLPTEAAFTSWKQLPWLVLSGKTGGIWAAPYCKMEWIMNASRRTELHLIFSQRWTSCSRLETRTSSRWGELWGGLAGAEKGDVQASLDVVITHSVFWRMQPLNPCGTALLLKLGLWENGQIIVLGLLGGRRGSSWVSAGQPASLRSWEIYWVEFVMWAKSWWVKLLLLDLSSGKEESWGGCPLFSEDVLQCG